MSARSQTRLLLTRITELADKLSDGGLHPVVGYAWRNPQTGAHGTGVFRTDAQRESLDFAPKIAPELIRKIPWNSRKWARYHSLIRKLRESGCEVIEIYK